MVTSEMTFATYFAQIGEGLYHAGFFMNELYGYSLISPKPPYGFNKKGILGKVQAGL